MRLSMEDLVDVYFILRFRKGGELFFCGEFKRGKLVV